MASVGGASGPGPAVCYFIGTRPTDCASASVEMPPDVRVQYLRSDGGGGSPRNSIAPPGSPATHAHALATGNGAHHNGRADGEDETRTHTQLYQRSGSAEFHHGSGSDGSVGSPSVRSTPSASDAMLFLGGNSELDLSRIRVSTDSGASHEQLNAPLVVDNEPTLKEGRLLMQKPNSSVWQRRHVVLNRRQLVYFSASGKMASGIIPTDTITRVFLRASSDYAIEITVASIDVFILLADTMQANEQWVLALLQTTQAFVRDQLVPQTIDVGLPNISGTDAVPVTLETVASQVIRYLKDKFDDPRFDMCSLCLRRGDRLTWLNETDRVLSTSIIFQSHVLECRKNSERESMDRMRAASMRIQRPHEVEGYLMKQGAEGPVKAWRRRFFFSQGSYLFYTKSHASKGGSDTMRVHSEAIGFINLESSTAIDHDPNPRSTVFDIVTPGRIYRLQASSRDEMVLWIVSLRRIREFQRQQASEHQTRIQSWSSIQSAAALLRTKRDGVLWKRGYYNRSWQERYCILTDGYLCYFDSRETTKQLRGRIPLAGSHVVTLPEEDASNAFSIVTANRTYVLHAESQVSMEEWLDAINREKTAAA